MIPLEGISANPYQPRRVFDEEKLNELAASIAEKGVLQPIFARATGDGYQVIAGERRVRAARQAGLIEIPALVREITENEMMEISLIENIQRADLDPVEEARAYKRLSDEFSQTQERIAQRVSKSRSYVANSMRLLNLPDPVLAHLGAGILSIGHVRPLLSLNEQDAIALADRIIREKGTAREAELWARQAAGPVIDDAEPTDDAAPADDSMSQMAADSAMDKPEKLLLPVELKEIQRLLREAVNTKVEVTHGSKGGKVIIDYYTQDDLERILELITGSREIE
jgi:ParB family chromosome partitioning protein